MFTKKNNKKKQADITACKSIIQWNWCQQKLNDNGKNVMSYCYFCFYLVEILVLWANDNFTFVSNISKKKSVKANLKHSDRKWGIKNTGLKYLNKRWGFLLVCSLWCMNNCPNYYTPPFQKRNWHGSLIRIIEYFGHITLLSMALK